MSEPIIFGQPHLGDEEVELVTRTLRSSWIGQGPLVAEFERRLAAEIWSDQVVAVSSCTAALELSLLGLGIGAGDEVITTPLTFVATVNAIQAVGATPVLADIDPQTLLVETAAVEAAITERTRAIMPVSFGGRPLDIELLLDLARARDLFVVEDAAHSVGAVADGLPVGASRDPRLVTCFSFYPNKNLASAEGGAIALPDEDLAARLRGHRLHGLNGDAWNRYRDRQLVATLATLEGRKANWTDVQAAIALPQLSKLDGFIATREYLAECYDAALGSIPTVQTIARPAPSLAQRHALHLYQVRVPAVVRDSVVQDLRDEGVGASIHYPAIHRHPFHQHLACGGFPAAEQASDELISLPLHPGMSERHVERVCRTLAASCDRRSSASQ